MRLKSLDCLRGLAVLVILLQNGFLLIPNFASAFAAKWSPNLRLDMQIIAHSPLHLLWAGQEALALFFVLAGMFALQQYENGLPSWKFLLNRFCRVYLPFAFSIGLGALLIVALRHLSLGQLRAPWLSPDTLDVTSPGFPRILGQVLLLIDTASAQAMNPAAGPVIHLLRLYLLFPLLVWLLERIPNLLLTAALGIFIAAQIGIKNHTGWSPAELSALGTLSYLFFLTLGAWMGLHLHELRNFFWGLRSWQYWLLISLATLIVDAHWEISSKVGDWAAAIGDAIVIILALEWPSFRRTLGGPILSFLGRISFSLYLTHLLVLSVLGRIFAETMPLREAVPLAVAATLPIATIFYLIAEWPAHRLSRFFTAPFAGINTFGKFIEGEVYVPPDSGNVGNPPARVAMEAHR